MYNHYKDKNRPDFGFIILLIIIIWLISSKKQAKSQEILKQLKTPDSEVEDFIVWLQEQPESDRPFLRGLTTYAVPEQLRPDVSVQLSFLLHSLVGLSSDKDGGAAGSYYPVALAKNPVAQDKAVTNEWDKKSLEKVQSIPKSDTLYWIDVRDYNWTPESWEAITSFDGYMVEPIIKHENNGLLRLLAGNAVVRADWFVYHASRSTEQVDKLKTNKSIYRTLLYAQAKEPKTVQEFRATWGLPDIEKSRQIGNEYGTLVTKSKNVSRNNRMLFGYRTELGWLYQTYDVKHEQGKRDYVERFYEFGGKPPDIFDGGEIFATNLLKLQVYDLYDDKQNLADFADATIVRHLTDVLGDTRVSSPHSCFDCHAEGPIPSENTINNFLKKNGKIYYPVKNDQLRVDRAFLNNKFEDSIVENQNTFAQALYRVNGLRPVDNVKSYYRVVNWYNKPLTVEQAAFECGVTVEDLKKKSLEGLQEYNNKIPGRLALLLDSNEAIPRDVWEAPNTDGIPGIFQQTMIVINGLTKITTTITTKYVATVSKRCNIYKGGTVVLRQVEVGTKIVKLNEENKGFTEIELEDGTVGWIESGNITTNTK